MNFLITGGAGSVGRDVSASLLGKGHRVRILDRKAEASSAAPGANLESIRGSVEDAALVREALQGVDAVVHLAWSFADDPAELLRVDLAGHVALLDACVAAKVSRFFYASTAVVYGKPLSLPMTEEAPCLVEEARKPYYAIAKHAAERLALACWRSQGLPVVVFRFWWSFGEEIGGRHLRDMIALARSGEPVAVAEGAGGSFLDHEDLTHALLLAAQERRSVGQLFNLATIYLEWQAIARIVMKVTDSSSRLDVVPASEWQGAKFLADSWELSVAKAERLLAYRSLFSPAIARQRLEKAIAQCAADPSAKP